VQLPDVGADVAAGSAVGEVESTKSVSDLFAPVSGTVVAVNEALSDAPELINAAPYENGWMLDIRVADPPDGLLDAAAYRELVGD
jgi:glycine cleavage system H protein